MATTVKAEEGSQEIFIEREFNASPELVYKGFTEYDLIEQWMGTEVMKLENKQHGSYHFKTTDPMGNEHHFHGTIHNVVPGKSIVRTFEMEGTSFPPQMEFLNFSSVSGDRCKLTMHVIYQSNKVRDEHLKMPFREGINMAHNRLEQLLNERL